MPRGEKPAEANSDAGLAAARKSLRIEASRRRELEKRLAESLERESATDRALTEALEQQTATSEILGAISRSPTDIQPVLDTVVESAARLCEAYDASIVLRRGNRLVMAAHHGPIHDASAIARALGTTGGYTLSLDRGTIGGRTVLDARTVHIADVQVEAEEFPEASENARRLGFHTMLSVPLMREGVAIGAIQLPRTEVRLFTERQVALLKTFADQAVIAIENVRLSNEMKEALERQTATSEILRVISSSPTDIRPVFDAIVRSAVHLCNGLNSAAFLYDGESIHNVALSDPSPEASQEIARHFPQRPNREFGAGRVVLTGAIVHSADVLSDPNFGEGARRVLQLRGVRALLLAPMLRDGRVIGVISVGRAEPGLFTDSHVQLLQTFADQAVIAVENVHQFTELEARNREVTEALDQKTATSEILGVISSSPTDIQPVFDAIMRSAVRLSGARFGGIYRFDGEMVHFVGQYGSDPDALETYQRMFPMRPDRGALGPRSILDRAVVHVPDVFQDPEYLGKDLARASGWRSSIAVPMLREGIPNGAIVISKAEPGPFSHGQIELLKTFAAQAVIAIENVRLFTETKEALEQQTATAEILRAISSSPTDVQPVFDIIAESAVRLCGAEASTVTRFDGEWVHLAAVYGSSPEGVEGVRRSYPVRAGSASAAARSIRDRAISHIPDVLIDQEYGFQEAAVASRFRASLAVPMLHEGRAIGAIAIGRSEPGEFSERQVGLLRTFADQAIIAIENVRLFKELQASNRELTSSLDTQTATSDILRAISRSQTDVQPVFDAIVASAVRLLGGYSGGLTRVVGAQRELAAFMSTDPAAAATLSATYPRPLDSRGAHGQAIRDRAPVNILDMHTDLRVTEAGRDAARIAGYRSVVTVPLLRHDEAIGALGVTRREPGGFTDDEIALLQTFADQAVIAIENARLLSELKQRNEALTQAHAQVSEALEQQTATAEILRVISRSPTDVQPVFDTIVRSAVRLCDGLFSALDQFDGELLHSVAEHNYTPEALEELHRMFPARPTRSLGVGRAILERAVVHIPDVELDPEYQQPVLSRAIGFRSGLFVPMLREGAPIGVILVARAEPRPFTDNQIELLKTFADQAVIAVENVRLFKELQARTGELIRSVDQLTALGEISQAVSSTLDVETVLQTIVSRASQLAGADGCAIYEYDHATETFHIRATHSLDADLVATLRASPLRKGEGAMGRAAETREATQIADIAAPGAYQSHLRDTLLAAGYRALLSVPLLREGEIIGSLSLNRRTPGEFPPEAVEVLKTFATQSALAIQNARLFREIADKSAQLEAASRHKSEFLANMSHELRTPLNAIIGFSEILAEKMFGDINEKQTEYLQDILESGRHLLSLINDILDLSKIEAGRMELELAEFDLPSAIENALILVRERASRRGIRLGSTVDERLGRIDGDERKVKQVLLNLLSNALKFTPEGGRIEVGARLDGAVVEVSVADTGIGIAPEDQTAVFEEFRQVGTADKKAEGTGLGLALSRKFIELHGGRIWVKSQLGAGSTFAFTLPLGG